MKRYFGAIWFGTLLVIVLNGCFNFENRDFVETEGAVQTESEMKETEQKNEQSYCGTWGVKDYQSAEVSALSKEDIETFLDYTITYQEDAVLQNGQNMNVAEFGYEYEIYTEELLVQLYNVNLGEWWDAKPQVLGVFVTSPENFFGSQFFVADDETLWIYYEGVFFLAKKVVS